MNPKKFKKMLTMVIMASLGIMGVLREESSFSEGGGAVYRGDRIVTTEKFDRILLSVVCDECEGNSDPRSPSSCSKCHGKGEIPTTDGQNILDFVEKMLMGPETWGADPLMRIG